MTKDKKRILLVGGICLLLLLLAVMVVILLSPGKSDVPEKESTPTQEQLDSQPHAADPTKPSETDPTKPSQTDPTKPNQTDPTKPNQTDPTKPSETDPTKPEQTDPTKPEQTDPTKPSQTDPTKPEQTDPTKPEQTDPTKPEQTDPTEPSKPDPTEPQEPDTEPEETTPTPTDPPPVVIIPGKDEKTGLEFPCEVPGHNLQIEKLAPYSGIFVEDGTNTQVEDVAMLLIHNEGKEAIEYTEITVTYPEKTLTFHISALPAGERMVVQEKTGQTVPEAVPQEAKALIVRRAQMEIAPEISVVDNGDNSLTVTNLTEKSIPAVRVFYKYYMEEEDLFVGGIAFTVRITRLAAKGSTVIRPSHYVSQTSRVVMALTYDS